uniref:plasmid segregation protein ParM domain-containing protein n=1 Tax=Salmonella sp. TaxID=599 RepID=UPI003995DBC0
MCVSEVEQEDAHFIDDGSAISKCCARTRRGNSPHISPNSFKRGWSATFGAGKPFNYVIDDEKYCMI